MSVLHRFNTPTPNCLTSKQSSKNSESSRRESRFGPHDITKQQSRSRLSSSLPFCVFLYT
ncbi:hypothetical protein I7I53_01529 [Histoplasma capsulatum var. duboisii H88]|uniref:Uncharacterized protein n=1 Tax=Ajellomyces capsulatus (strain H88) TaxID=544711 RepID=A0A8A1LJE5_AJEC8|nr:hypothetical protein I7I53_01529 [Histoplasma capsulatum var. duboisii H88]